MYYVVDYELCAAFFMLLLIVVSVLKKDFGNYQSRIYRTYLFMVFAELGLDVITCYTIMYHQQVDLWLNYLLNSLFMIIQFIVPTLFMVYVHLNVADVRNTNPFMWKWVFFPPALGIVLVLTNVWTEAIFYFDENGYHHGNVHWYLYGNAVICAVGTILYMFHAKKYLDKKQCYIIIGIIVVSMLPTLVQFILPNYMLSGVGSALSVFMIYMMHVFHVLKDNSRTQ